MLQPTEGDVLIEVLDSRGPETTAKLSPQCFPKVIGFDCEGINLSAWGKLCIIQIWTGDRVILVDPLTAGPEIVSVDMRELLESTEVVKVIHDCRRDAEAFFHQFSVSLKGVFDTSLAHRVLEEQTHGKQLTTSVSFVHLLQQFCGIDYSEKGEVKLRMRADEENFWEERPLNEQMKRCASNDVKFLLDIHEQLYSALSPHNRNKVAMYSQLYCDAFCDALSTADTILTPGPSDDKDTLYLRVVSVPSNLMGKVIGKQGNNIKRIQEMCSADVFTGGEKGPKNVFFVVGSLMGAQMAESMIRGCVI